MGSDASGLLITDPAFAGSDTLATARALAAAIRLVGPFDLVLCGRNSVDADTGQVGPELAELLDLPFATGVRHLALEDGVAHVRAEHDDGWVQADVRLPAILSTAERLCDPCKMDPEARARRLRRHDPHVARRRSGCRSVGPGRVTHDRGRDPAPRLESRRHPPAGPPAGRTGGRRRRAARRTRRARGRGHHHDPTRFPARDPDGAVDVLVAVEPLRDVLTRELLGSAATLAASRGARRRSRRRRRCRREASRIVGCRPRGRRRGRGRRRRRRRRARVLLYEPFALGRARAEHGVGPRGRVTRRGQARRRAHRRCRRPRGPTTTGSSRGSPRSAVSSSPRSPRARRSRWRRCGRACCRCSAPRASAAAVEHVDRRAAAVACTVLARTRDDDLDVARRRPGGRRDRPGRRPGRVRRRSSRCSPRSTPSSRATRKVTDKGWLPHARQIGITGRSIAPRLFVSHRRERQVQPLGRGPRRAHRARDQHRSRRTDLRRGRRRHRRRLARGAVAPRRRAVLAPAISPRRATFPLRPGARTRAEERPRSRRHRSRRDPQTVEADDVLADPVDPVVDRPSPGPAPPARARPWRGSSRTPTPRPAGR